LKSDIYFFRLYVREEGKVDFMRNDSEIYLDGRKRVMRTRVLRLFV
jgi:hypothetical protein